MVDVLADLPALRRDPEYVCDLLNNVANQLLQPLKLSRHDAVIDLIEKGDEDDPMVDSTLPKNGAHEFTDKD